MTKVCPKCKTVNIDTSGFCQKCGEELKEPVNVSQKDKELSGGWWSRQSSGGKAAIGLVGICCIGLILIVAIVGMISPDKILSNLTNSTQPITNQNTTAIGDKTFHGSGVSFNYPNSWSVYTPGNVTTDEVVNLKRTEPGISLLTVTKQSAKGHSLTYWQGILQAPAKSNGNELVSTKSVTVDGSLGYQITWKYSSSGGGEQQSTFFIKNDTLYDTLLTTDSVSSIQSDINTILNSFKVT